MSLIEVRSVSKRFGAVQALDSVSASFEPGEVHAVLGENGAGKSTLMGVLAGFVRPDSGTVSLNGEPLPLGEPHETKRKGIRIVHQHFMLVPAFTVEENFALASLETLSGRLDPGASQPYLDVAERLGWELPKHELAGDLPVGVQQRIEIAKALGDPGNVLILDEPTAVLSPEEVADLFRVVRALKAEGMAVILIAHKLAEVLEIADRVTVLRGGKFVATAERKDVDADKLTRWMVGEPPALNAPSSPTTGEPLLRVRDLNLNADRGHAAVRGVSFEVRPGEVFGIGGVDGNGQLELAEAIVGIREPLSGVIEKPERVGYIPADRQADGLALTMSVVDNTLIGAEAPGVLSPRVCCENAETLVKRFDVRLGNIEDPVGSLSGGNQQKVVVGRVLSGEPKVIVAVNPTRGLDVRATAFVRQSLLDAARNGAAVVLFSADHDELSEIATTVRYLNRGVLVEGAGAMVR